MSIIKEYFELYEKYIKEYGENTCIFIQIGSFYENYSVKNKKEEIGNAHIVSSLLNIQLTKRSKKDLEVNRKNPYMCGIPVAIFKDKYMSVLVDNNYTVIIIDQVSTETPIERPKKKISSIFIQARKNGTHLKLR